MDEYDKIYEDFYSRCSPLSLDRIREMGELEPSAGISNVLTGLMKHCFGVYLVDENEMDYVLFYINGRGELSGFALQLRLALETREGLILIFSRFIADKFHVVDPVDAFNTFQTHTRAMLEKLNFFTYTSLEVARFAPGSFSIMAMGKRGIIRLEILDKPAFYASILTNNKKETPDYQDNYVYIMMNSKTNLFKIGRSKSPIFVRKRFNLRSHRLVCFVVGRHQEQLKENFTNHSPLKENEESGSS